MNLRHFIGSRPSSSVHSPRQSRLSLSIEQEEDAEVSTPLPNLFFVQKSGSNDHDGEKMVTVDDHQDLARIPVCAIFYKIARGQGVPHTFVGMIALSFVRLATVLTQVSSGFTRQWPALPRVVVSGHQSSRVRPTLTYCKVFLSVCVLPMARVPPDERYIVNKVRTLEGFYGVTYYLGYREKFDVQVSPYHRFCLQLYLACLAVNCAGQRGRAEDYSV